MSLLTGFIHSRNYNKETLAATASNITKDLMSIAKNMESQVKKGEQDLEVLGKNYVSTSTLFIFKILEDIQLLKRVMHTL